MLTREKVKQLVPEDLYRKAEYIVLHESFFEIRYSTEEYPIVEVDGGIYHQRAYRRVHMTYDDLEEAIVQALYQERSFYGNNWEEVLNELNVALLLAFLKKVEEGRISKKHFQIQTDSELTELIYDMEENIADCSHDVYLRPIVIGNHNHALKVEFRIGRTGTNGYVLKSVSTLCEGIKHGDLMDYGKQLSFVPSLESFTDESRSMIAFLMTLYDAKDQYNEAEPRGYGYYETQMYKPRVGRTLTLRGNYLDRFMEALGNQSVYYDNVKTGDLMYLKDEPVSFQSKVSKGKYNYFFGMSAYTYAEGTKYLYVCDPEAHMIHRMEHNRENQALFRLGEVSQGEPLRISNQDIRRFVKEFWPILSERTQTEVEDFDVQELLPVKPAYEIYLDLPEENVVTCRVDAVYKDGKFVVGNPRKSDLRNFDDEAKVERALSNWFDEKDPKSQFILRDNEKKMYQLLTEGIPYLQEIGDVFISERLKRLSVKKMSRVNVGISVKHDLLQLELSTDQRTLDDLSHILSKYQPKKKFYRLKNGDFVTVDDEQMEMLSRLYNDLQLSSTQIRKGEAEIPKYRAMYLDETAQLEKEVACDQKFRKLVNQVRNIENEEYEVPEEVRDILRPYQVDGYRWLKALQVNGFGGLLADEMGLGKSLQVITLLLSMENRGRSLIVCPASLVYNWDAEFKKFAPGISTVMLVGNASQRSTALKESAEDAVIITSYDALWRDIDAYEQMHFSVQIIDEAQYIKNPGTNAAGAVKEIKADFRIALTGTPIENRLSELWSIFDYIMPGFLYTQTKFRRAFESPIVKDEDEGTRDRLRKMITPFILRRLKRNVLKDLPDKLEEVMYAQLEGEQKAQYEARVQKLKLTVGAQSGEEFNNNKIAILAELTRLRQICCYPGLVLDNYNANSAKEEMCLDLIERAIEEGHKILLFSSFTTMLDELISRFKQKKISYHLLTGQTSKQKRAKMVESFQNDDVSVFCISLKAGGTGLNLTAADIVIHYDPWWNTAVEDQATDRAHRIGQENVVSVYRLIMKDTVEERIIELQEGKSDLADQILGGEDVGKHTLTKEQLLEILR